MITKILRTEALFVLALTLIVYSAHHLPWYWLLLILLPDISMVGYIKNVRLGATLYNLGHTYTFAVLLIGIAIYTSCTTLLTIALIWIAHIAMDRALGYGLKYATGFQDTHLGKIGK